MRLEISEWNKLKQKVGNVQSRSSNRFLFVSVVAQQKNLKASILEVVLWTELTMVVIMVIVMIMMMVVMS